VSVERVGGVAGYVWQSMRRDWRIALTHHAPFVFDLLGLVANCAVFYFLGRFAGHAHSRASFFAFAVAGLAILRLNSGMPRIVQGLTEGLGSGNLELLLNTRRAPATVVIGESSFELLRGGLLASAAVGVAVAVFGAPASTAPAGLLAVAFGLLVAVVLFFGLAALTAAALLVIRQAGALTTLGSMAMPLVAGAYFPIGSLPQPLEAISAVLPFRAAVELIRGGLLHGSFLTAPAVELCAGTLVFVGVALFAFDRAVRHARNASTLGLA